SASPYGELEKIVNAGNNKVVDLSDEKKSTPTSIELAPGKYLVTLNGPNGQQTTVDVEIKAGERTRKRIPMGNVDWDQLQKDMDLQKESNPICSVCERHSSLLLRFSWLQRRRRRGTTTMTPASKRSAVVTGQPRLRR